MAVYGDRDYLPGSWKLGYQMRQFGCTDADTGDGDVLSALATPPQAMVTAKDQGTI